MNRHMENWGLFNFKFNLKSEKKIKIIIINTGRLQELNVGVICPFFSFFHKKLKFILPKLGMLTKLIAVALPAIHH